jgi:ureidoglycolate lyase
MAGVEFLMRRVECQTISAETFAPFGSLIDARSVVPELINDGSTKRYSDLATLDLKGGIADPKLSIYVASARTFPMKIAKLECHRQASQLFMPLGMQRFLVVVAPGTDQPDWHRVSAFLTEPGQGVCLHRRTWHHGLIAINDADRFAVIEGGDYRQDTEEIDAEKDLWLILPLGLDLGNVRLQQ